ncbi:MAG: SIS domain-containing protein [Clostridia bacterium]|nr:SIS domain-containing protein [Clostridia bacterium]
MNEICKLTARYPALCSCENEILAAAELMVQTYEHGGKILLCGNGGSAADCDHIAGELLKGFLLPRKVENEKIPAAIREKLQGALPAVSLPSLTAALTASINDLDAEFVYAQLLYGLAKEGDLLIAISTSGNSPNVLHAAELARAVGVKTLALTGNSGGRLAKIADISICVPESETYLVQELHLPVYHFLCAETERRIFQPFGDFN